MLRRRRRIVDPRHPRPQLKDPARVDASDAYGPRTVKQHDKDQPVPLRILVFGGFLVIAFLALGYNLFSLQISQGKHFSDLAEGNRVREETVLAPRGIIFDRHGTQLVVNEGSFAVALVPIDLAKAGDARARELALFQRLTGISGDEVQRQADDHNGEPFQPVVLKKNLDNATYEAISENLPKPARDPAGVRHHTPLHRRRRPLPHPGVRRQARPAGVPGPARPGSTCLTTPSARPGWSSPTSSTCAAPAGSRSSRPTPRARSCSRSQRPIRCRATTST